VLFIQGVGVAGDGWKPQTDELAREFATLRFDHRGIGRSAAVAGPVTVEAMAADALAVMDAAGWASAHVVGHSLGGVIAQQLALDAPARVRSLALLCTFCRGKEGARVTPRIAWLGLRTRVGTRRMRRRAMLEMIFPAAYLRTVDADELAARCGALFGRDLADSPPILLKQLRALGAHDISARLGELAKIPAMVISGEHDPIAPPAFGRELAERLGNASFEVIAGVSHAVVIQQAVRINDRLRNFWLRIEQAAGNP
jgi:aminoacrylate hydrolase